ncbi:cytochrome P450 [Nemania abortiva]|nr:cytochrome P450 [Nemania abortiva]
MATMALQNLEELHLVMLATSAILFCAWQLWDRYRLAREDYTNKYRRNIPLIAHDGLVSRWLPALYYLLRGPEILLRNYTAGQPFAVTTPGACYIHFSSESHVKELIEAPSEKLSLHALSKDMFKPEYTMNGLEVQDTTSGNGNQHTRVFRVILTSYLPMLRHPLAHTIANAFSQELSVGKIRGDKVQVSAFAMAKRVMAAANAFVFFGETLSADPQFLDAALAYPEDLFFTAEILRLAPSLIHPILAPVLMRNHKASKTLVKYLSPVVEQRLRQARGNRSSDRNQQSKPIDCIQFFVDVNSHKDRWTAEKIVQVLLGTWFAAVHQPALTLVYALQDICDNVDYAELLREEIHTGGYSVGMDDPTSSLKSSLDDAPLLDAFLKESARMHPSDAISVRRKVLKPYTFADGTQLLPGDVACVPSQAMMRDEKHYSSSTTFSPSRFMTPKKNIKSGYGEGFETASRFTSTDLRYPFWGLGRHSCPGRFYASLVLKLVIAHVLTHYEIEPTAQSGSRTWSYRSSILPSTGFLFRIRGEVKR